MKRTHNVAPQAHSSINTMANFHTAPTFGRNIKRNNTGRNFAQNTGSPQTNANI